jgi:hypothetical protein
VFIHPAKTGGTSIEKALEPFCVERIQFDFKVGHWFAMYHSGRNTKHHSFTMYQSFLYDYDLSDYKVLFTVRNPWDRVLSMWAYQEGMKTVGEKLQDNVENFRYFARNYYKDFIYGNINIVHLIDGCNRALSVTIRFENLQEDFNLACDCIGIERTKLPHLVESKHNDRYFYYDDETRRIVAGLFAPDIEYFGFEF